MHNRNILAATFALLITSGCSDNASDHQASAKPKDDHIWKEQTRAIERAQEAETVIMDTTKKRLEQSEQQTQ